MNIPSNHSYHYQAFRMKTTYQTIFIIAIIFLIVGCQSAPIPKPRGYFRLDFPEKQYRLFDTTFPYKFQYPVYGKVIKDNQRGAEPYWINVEFPKYKAKFHISYKQVNGNLDALTEDIRTLAYKHTVKADAINEKQFVDPTKKVYGILYNIRGNAASSFQFYVTDSTKHFLRGALYFSTHPNKDSLAPAIEFFGKDMIALIESLEWK